MQESTTIFMSEAFTYGFMIVNGLAVLLLFVYFWRRGYFTDSDSVSALIFDTDEPKGETNE